MEEGAKFCMGCGTPVETVSAPQQTQAATATPAQMKGNTAQGPAEAPKKKSKLLLIAAILDPALWAVFCIVMLTITAKDMSGRMDGWYIGRSKEAYIEYMMRSSEEALVESLKDVETAERTEAYERGMEIIKNQVPNWEEEYRKSEEEHRKALEKDEKNTMIARILLPIAGLLIIAIPTLLNLQGQKKNSRKMILAAGIVYCVTFFGIPSGVLCFIEYKKMKKQ
jgi:hypothetical protein